MDNNAIKCQIRAFAIMAKIEAMKTQNEASKMEGIFPYYPSGDFLSLSNDLCELAEIVEGNS